MKVDLSTQTLFDDIWETVEITTEDSAIKSAERIALALKKGGTNARVLICPESAAEYNRLLDEGRSRASQIWHTNLIKPSRAREKAHARFLKILGIFH